MQTVAVKIQKWVETSTQSHGIPSLENEVFSINFLRRQYLPLPVRRFLAYAATGYLLLNVLILVVMVLVSWNMQHQKGLIRSELMSKLPAGVGLEDVEPEMKVLSDQISERLIQLKSIIALHESRFLITEKLAGIARTVPPRTWISKIQGSQQKHSLLIRAYYLMDPNNPYQYPTKGWMEALQSDPDFSQGLINVELKRSSQKTQGQADIYSFDLSAQWAGGMENTR